ncbi:hypothetical protein J4E85_010281 [Alternaria conjuncta]|uniref:uncharacterized protein n=1 Tax=Alternaria conjuncta TaxID=181017 RepID=UPI0022206113|nr:uncharacterized protein J4E85_010281 [Alternaria conjuncta]KAI4916193.1 hypothetical protein J4E85_010281 [Alternaria conjuncta]
MSTRDSDKETPYIPHNSLKQDGYSKEGEATATCYCGAVQLAFPTTAPGLVDTFVCHCTDCRKITASAFTSAFIVAASAVKHIRGQDNLKKFSQSQTTASGQAMTNCFCDTCGTLMYRLTERHPEFTLMRLGTVDDLNLMEGLLRPKREVYVKDRVSWVHGVEGARQSEIME